MEKKKLDSHDLADELRKAADFLSGKKAFPLEGILCITPSYNQEFSCSLSYYTKDIFVEAVKAFGNSTKRYGTGAYANFYVTSTEMPLSLEICRDKVCRKITTYECDPLFSEDELKEL